MHTHMHKPLIQLFSLEENKGYGMIQLNRDETNGKHMLTIYLELSFQSIQWYVKLP